jgi:hypothetical protein
VGKRAVLSVGEKEQVCACREQATQLNNANCFFHLRGKPNPSVTAVLEIFLVGKDMGEL